MFWGLLWTWIFLLTRRFISFPSSVGISLFHLVATCVHIKWFDFCYLVQFISWDLIVPIYSVQRNMVFAKIHRLHPFKVIFFIDLRKQSYTTDNLTYFHVPGVNEAIFQVDLKFQISIVLPIHLKRNLAKDILNKFLWEKNSLY